ncbi:GNAT family N-acetyltransferase [Sphingomonas sp. QA11]|jgi:ribosomal protein S18 acetylase RimI-like enzyme|uniref:Acetyltransferase n=1 Tax=hydrothermal vent metagenome TaxID=652676 RepID=A0A160TQ17_9ZZZZ|nr:MULTISPECIES: GNAT family N-acetyltransferase [unclassified Sphingomonas]WCM26776.1 GNAT family N-acetyltransferase [Sphingomonas sp. QA11]WEJ98682.1 MAG: GNAT family N-acetyltransferase [Sphingomonas sp.]
MISYRDARTIDGPALAAMARRSFTETFGNLYRQSDLAAFLDEAFGANGLPSQLSDPDFTVRLALDDGEVIGFVKMGPVTFPGEWRPDAIELYQFYVLGPWQGQGVAPVMMDWALEHSREHGAKEVILSVYVDNHRARRFYERYGFEEIGRYAFRVGETIDDDRIMRLVL